MSAAPPPPLPSPSRASPYKILQTSASSSLFRKSSELRFSKDNKKKNQIRCEQRSFESPQKWTVDCVSSGGDPIHIILKPPPRITMASSAGLDSTGKSSKRVCLFYCSEMKALAERIAAESDAIELRSITWRYYAFRLHFPILRYAYTYI